MGDLSPHFDRAEFACKHCGRVRVSCELVQLLEDIRSAIGDRPIHLVSGYRCSAHNAAVGGSPRSRHVRGDAADLPLRLVTGEQARLAGARGIGTEGPWARHVDMRPEPATWSYQR